MFDERSKLALIVTCLLLVGSRGAFEGVQRFLGAYLHKEEVPIRLDFSLINRQMGEFNAEGADDVLDEAMVDALGTRTYLNRVYHRESTPPHEIYTHLAYYTGLIDPVPHVPDRCLVAAGLQAKTRPENISLSLDRRLWRAYPDRMNEALNQPYQYREIRDPFTRELQNVTMPMGDVQLRITEFADPEKPEIRIFAGYFFIANGRTTPSPDGVRLLAFKLTERYAYYCKVQLMVVAPPGFGKEHFVKLVTEFLDDFLPDIMRCIPDWWEVTHGAAAGSNG